MSEDSIFSHLDSAALPEVERSFLRELAKLWQHQLDQVMARVIEIGQQEGGRVQHVDSRPQLVHEAAKLVFLITEGIVEHRTQGRRIHDIDLETEQLFLASSEGKALVENTARNVYTAVWSKVLESVDKQFPLVVVPSMSESPSPSLGWKNRSDHGVKRNHFVPRSTIKPWSDESGLLMQFRRTPDGVVSKCEGPKSWGYEPFLYSLRLEDWFEKLESRAARPYRKLLALEPMSSDDEYFFIALLVVQHLRTPKYMTSIAEGLHKLGEVKQWDFGPQPEHLRRLHESLFERDDLFQRYFQQIKRARWRFLAPPSENVFPRTDNPVVISRGEDGGWACLYPMAPGKCLLIGPDLAEDGDVPFPLTNQLEVSQFEDLCSQLLAAADKSFVVTTEQDRERWLQRAEQSLARGSMVTTYRAWGPLEDI